MGNIVATGIEQSPHLVAFDSAARQALGEIDLTPLLVYIVDLANDDVLNVLADQFRLTGLYGYNLAKTTEQKRDLIREGIAIHRTRGSIASIKKAVEAVGFLESSLIEGAGLDLDGSFFLDGSRQLTGGDWAAYRLSVKPQDGVAVTVEDYENLLRALREFAPARCRLIGTILRLDFETLLDGGVIEDVIDVYIGDDLLNIAGSGFFMDGGIGLDGAELLDHLDDPGQITITTNGIPVIEII